MQTAVMYFNSATGSNAFINITAISKIKYIISTMTLYAILDNKTWNSDKALPFIGLQSLDGQFCNRSIFLLSADTNIVIMATENEIKIATMFICTLTNSEKIVLQLFMSPKSNTNAPIRVAMPIRNGMSSFNQICFLDLK